jgi:hypothetical protein
MILKKTFTFSVNPQILARERETEKAFEEKKSKWKEVEGKFPDHTKTMGRRPEVNEDPEHACSSIIHRFLGGER